MQSLWGEEFTIPTNDTKSQVDTIIEKINNPEELNQDEFKKLIKKKNPQLKFQLGV